MLLRFYGDVNIDLNSAIFFGRRGVHDEVFCFLDHATDLLYCTVLCWKISQSGV